jgi:glutamine amidotransferase
MVIVDYGRGNLRSVHKAFESVGLRVTITSRPQDVLDASAVVLPGVGAFRDCMQTLERLGLIAPLLRSLEGGKPYLGLCLGLQILFEESEEFGTSPGLGFLPGRVRRFPQCGADGEMLKIPHMGWNTIRVRRPCPLFGGLPEEPYFYFLHSYYVEPGDTDLTVAETEYGVRFTCAIQKENVLALQFHPEKSQRAGLAVLRNFGKVVGR